MKSYYRCTTALAALALTYTLAAPARAEDWSGSYLGVNVGMQAPSFTNNWNSGNSDHQGPVNDLNDPGFLVGTTLGHNWEADRRVFGVEADISGGRLANTTYYLALDGQVTNSERAELRIYALSSIRARTGLDLGDGNMAYASVGIGFVSADFAASTSDTDPRSGITDLSSSVPVVGLGYQKRLGDRVSLDANISHYRIDKYKFVGSLGDGGTAGSEVDFGDLTTATLGFRFHL